MKYFIPTYEQAKEIVAKNSSLVFYETIHRLEGFKVSVFNYRLASYNDFIHPVVGMDYHARELRGLTYVFNEDGSYRTFLMLDKFFNINQVEETQYNLIKDLKIKSIYNKEDGSLISFIQLPNGKVLAKTRAGFDNEQALDANHMYNTNKSIKSLVDYCMLNGLNPQFEYVGFKNRIVLSYGESELILLRVRNSNGEYLNIEDFAHFGVKLVQSEPIVSLDQILKSFETLTDKEGVVITFENDLMVKTKTEWYCNLHRLVTESLNRENIVISMILDNTIDDAIAQLDPNQNKEKLEWIGTIEKMVKDYIASRFVEITDFLTLYKGDKKDFAIRYNKDKNFYIAMKVISGNDLYESIVEYVRKRTQHLIQAQNFVKTGKM